MSVLHIFYIAFSDNCYTFSQSVYAYIATHMKITEPFAVLATSYVKSSTFRDESHEIYCNDYVNQYYWLGKRT